MNQTHAINAGLLALATLTLALFDATLSLGDMHGLVFTLYLVFFSALQLLANAALALRAYYKHASYAHYVQSAIIYPLLGVAIAYAGPALV